MSICAAFPDNSCILASPKSPSPHSSVARCCCLCNYPYTSHQRILLAFPSWRQRPFTQIAWRQFCASERCLLKCISYKNTQITWLHDLSPPLACTILDYGLIFCLFSFVDYKLYKSRDLVCLVHFWSMIPGMVRAHNGHSIILNEWQKTQGLCFLISSLSTGLVTY
jgi:hypothetical protein